MKEETVKRFVYYWVDRSGDWSMDYWTAKDFRTCKKEIFHAYRNEIKKGLKILFIAEIKYEEEL